MDLDSAKKAVLNCQKAGGNWNDLAEYMGEAKSGLHNYGNANRPDADPRNKPLSWWLSLQSFAGQPIVTQAMAEHDDLVCMPIDRLDRPVESMLLEMAGTSGEVVKTAVLALSDGVIDGREKKDISQKLMCMQAIVMDLSRAVNHAGRSNVG